MRISLTSVFVDDQTKALAFYTDVLGFQKHRDIPSEAPPGSRWSHPRHPMVPNCSSNRPAIRR